MFNRSSLMCVWFAPTQWYSNCESSPNLKTMKQCHFRTLLLVQRFPSTMSVSRLHSANLLRHSIHSRSWGCVHRTLHFIIFLLHLYIIMYFFTIFLLSIYILSSLPLYILVFPGFSMTSFTFRLCIWVGDTFNNLFAISSVRHCTEILLMSDQLGKLPVKYVNELYFIFTTVAV